MKLTDSANKILPRTSIGVQCSEMAISAMHIILSAKWGNIWNRIVVLLSTCKDQDQQSIITAELTSVSSLVQAHNFLRPEYVPARTSDYCTSLLERFRQLGQGFCHCVTMDPCQWVVASHNLTNSQASIQRHSQHSSPTLAITSRSHILISEQQHLLRYALFCWISCFVCS